MVNVAPIHTTLEEETQGLLTYLSDLRDDEERSFDIAALLKQLQKRDRPGEAVGRAGEGDADVEVDDGLPRPHGRSAEADTSEQFVVQAGRGVGRPHGVAAHVDAQGVGHVESVTEMHAAGLGGGDEPVLITADAGTRKGAEVVQLPEMTNSTKGSWTHCCRRCASTPRPSTRRASA